jgi:PKD repeat protein
VSANQLNYLYPSAGSYSTQLIVTNAMGCSDTSFATTSVMNLPLAGLGGTVTTCGLSYLLDAQNPGSTFLWQPDQQTTQQITVYNSGLYSVFVTDTNGCSSAESVSLTLNAIVKPQLGADTTVCGGLLLDAGYPGSQFVWQSAQTTQTIFANASGSFVVQVTDQNNCSGGDTIHVIVKTAAFTDLGSDTTLCKPDQGLLLLQQGNGISFIWNTGSTSNSISVNQSGHYSLKVISANGCEASDTVKVSFLNSPVVNLGDDIISCSPPLLDAQNSGCVYLWSTGSTLQSLEAMQTGIYHVTVTNPSSSCFDKDSISILLHPEVKVWLGNDTSVCSNAEFVLNAKNQGSAFLWSNGLQTQTQNIISTGVYGVTVTSNEGCKASDFIQVLIKKAPSVDIGDHLQYICGGKPLVVAVSNSSGVNWYGNGLQINKNEAVINAPGKYFVSVTENGCTTMDSLNVFTTANTIEAIFLASTIDTVNKAVKFVNLSKPTPLNQTWYFGDGQTSSEHSPVHIFTQPQTFSVTLEVSNGFCTDVVTKELNVFFKRVPTFRSAVARLEILEDVVYPNPCNREVVFDLLLNDAATISVYFMDLSGRLIYKEKLNDSFELHHTLNVEKLSNGLYFLNIECSSPKGETRSRHKVVKSD